MKSTDHASLPSRALAVAAIALLAACGGGGNGTFTDGIIGGTGLKGPVSGAAVSAYAIAGGALGGRIGTASTDSSGNFSMSIGSYSGPVMLQMSGGTYVDEATGATMPMASGDVMTAMLPTIAANATVSGVKLTPLTSMAQTMAQHLAGGLTDANINAANAAVGNYFMVSDILHTPPMNPLAAGSGTGASQDSIHYGMAMAAMSQYAKDLGMGTSSAMVTAMMSDASDGTMDGMMSGVAVMMGGMGMGGSMMPTHAGTAGLANAISTFTGSARNVSGVPLATMQSLINKLSSSSGQISGAMGTASAKSTVSGTVFNGTVSKATVSARAVSSGTMGAQLAATTTDAQGNFTLSFGAYGGPVMILANDAQYVDEATGTTMTMGSGDVMTAVMASIASGDDVAGMMVTPLTSMAQVRAQAMPGGMTDANIAAANAALGNYCLVGDILETMPMNTLVSGSAAIATQHQKNYGACIAAMSQYAMSVGMPVSSGMVTRMMDDAADGTMNGMTGSAPISMGMTGGGMMGGGQPQMMSPTAGTSELANALNTFMSSGANLSGATPSDVNALVQALTASNGVLQ